MQPMPWCDSNTLMCLARWDPQPFLVRECVVRVAWPLPGDPCPYHQHTVEGRCVYMYATCR